MARHTLGDKQKSRRRGQGIGLSKPESTETAQLPKDVIWKVNNKKILFPLPERERGTGGPPSMGLIRSGGRMKTITGQQPRISCSKTGPKGPGGKENEAIQRSRKKRGKKRDRFIRKGPERKVHLGEGGPQPESNNEVACKSSNRGAEPKGEAKPLAPLKKCDCWLGGSLVTDSH